MVIGRVSGGHQFEPALSDGSDTLRLYPLTGLDEDETAAVNTGILMTLVMKLDGIRMQLLIEAVRLLL